MDKKIKTLFLSYLEGTITAKEENILVELLKNNPDLINDLKGLFEVWNLSEMAGKLNSANMDKEWAKLMEKVNQSAVHHLNPFGLIGYWLPRVAAVFLLGAIVSFAVSYQIFNPKNAELVYHEINTPAGAKTKVTLPDGTDIWLNAGSNLKYSNEFGKKQREVFLTGEAYFDVETDPSKLFLVRTSELNIKAYGTEFNVKSYPEENTTETTLIEGSIGVTRTKFEKKKSDEVILEPNQRVVYYKSTRSIKTVEPTEEKIESEPVQIKREPQKLTYLISKGIDPEPFTSWKDGTLFITSETLEELAIKLERKYDVKIHFENEQLKNLKFTGSLENETVEQVIEAIGIAAKIDYEIEDRGIWFKKLNK